MSEITLTNKNFKKEVMESELPVLVDFWATWCGPCQMQGPILEKFAKLYDGKVKVGKVNVDEETELAREYSVMSIPTIILFKNGKVNKTSVGLLPESKLVEMVEE